MKRLTIGDLSLTQELDREAMNVMKGGILPGGCVDPVGVPTLPALPQMPTLPQLPNGYPFEPRWYPCF
jgi:hypothetical protein